MRSIEKLLTERSRPSLPESELKDKASERLMKLIERKRKKEENIVGAPARGAKKAEVVDLLEVLRQSLTARGESPGRRRFRWRPKHSFGKIFLWRWAHASNGNGRSSCG